MRGLLVVALFCQPALAADMILIKVGPTTWEQISDLSAIPYGESVVIRIKSDGENPPPPDTGLKADVTKAVKDANDQASAVSLRDMYTVTIALIDNSPPLDLLSAKGVLIQGEERILAGKSGWSEFRDITKRELNKSPLTVAAIKQIHAGLQAATGSQLSKAMHRWLTASQLDPVVEIAAPAPTKHVVSAPVDYQPVVEYAPAAKPVAKPVMSQSSNLVARTNTATAMRLRGAIVKPGKRNR